jgi:actin-related protein 2
MLVDNEKPGIPDMIFETIIASPMDCRKELYANIVLTGGSTMFPGYPTRVLKDLRTRFKRDIMKGEDYESGIKINGRNLTFLNLCQKFKKICFFSSN